MKNTFLLLAFISIFLSNNKVIAQCAVAESYVAKIQNAQDNWSPTKYASSGKQISAWTQFATWNTYKCQCDSPENLSDSEIPQLVNAMNATRGIISKEYSSYGTVPRVYKASDCKKGSSNSSNSESSKTSTQIEMENRFRNYNNAMSLKKQGESIAKAYAQQVKSYGELNNANSPEALLQNFNNNMQAIADLQTQNKADNLNQLSNTLSSTINDLSSGNHEGAMFSALSLLDQGEAKREAKKEAQRVQQNLIYQTQKKMTAFYMKAVELNDQAIKQYNEKAAYAYSKEEETYLLEYVKNLECHKQAMKTNFSYSNASWTQNKCPVPEKKKYTVNNLITKDIQYINAAKRKYALYEKTGEPIFQQGAMRFAGLAATENPKADYYYLMGRFSGINNPLVAYSSFLTVESKNAKYFDGDKKAEYSLIKFALESFFKTSIDENNQEVIKNIVGAGLHKSVEIDENSPIIYAIKIDQADVVYAFLNTELEGKPQSVIKSKVQSALFMSAILDAPNTIQKFADLGFSIDFKIDGKTPLDVAEQALAIKSFDKISELIGGQSKYTFNNSDLIKINILATSADINDRLKVKSIFSAFQITMAKHKALDLLFKGKNKDCFFYIYENNKELSTNWARENRNRIFKQFCDEVIYRENRHVYRYLTSGLISLPTGITLTDNDLYVFLEVWWKHTWNYHKMTTTERQESGLMGNFIEYSAPFLDHNVPWGKIVTLEYITSSQKYYQMNILDFAIYKRQDSRMVKVLLENYDNISVDLEKVIQDQSILNPEGNRDLLTKDKITREMKQNGYEILNMLIFDFNYNTDAFKLLANRRFDRKMNHNLIASDYLKKLIDQLIETGQGDINWNKEWDSGWFKQIKKRVKNWEDRQYWEAILKGDFDERY